MLVWIKLILSEIEPSPNATISELKSQCATMLDIVINLITPLETLLTEKVTGMVWKFCLTLSQSNISVLYEISVD